MSEGRRLLLWGIGGGILIGNALGLAGHAGIVTGALLAMVLFVVAR